MAETKTVSDRSTENDREGFAQVPLPARSVPAATPNHYEEKTVNFQTNINPRSHIPPSSLRLQFSDHVVRENVF